MATSTQTQADRTVRFEIETLTMVHWSAIVLAAITGAIHLYLYVNEGFPLFLLGGLGFFGAIVLLLFLPDYRPILYLAGIPYTLIFVAGWLAQGMPNFTLGVIDKAVELALIVLLGYLYLNRHR